METAQLWSARVGEIELYQGRAQDVLPTFPDGSFDVLLTDPPYGVPLRTSLEYRHENAGYVPDSGIRKGHGWILGDSDIDEVLATYAWVWEQADRLVSPTGHAYVMTSGKYLNEVTTAAQSVGWRTNVFTWIKTSSQPPFPGVPWGTATEFVVYGNRKLDMSVRYTGDHRNWWLGNTPRGRTRVHPTQKPVKLFEYLLTRTPGRVLDPFCGSGPVLLAAQRLGLSGVGVDAEQQWVDAATTRLTLDPEEVYP